MPTTQIRRQFKERLFEYSNHRSFLNSYFRYRKQVNPRFTLASWARMIELSSGPHLGRILNGERCPSDRTTDKLCSYFEFNKKEREYFENLVILEKTKQDTRISELVTDRLKKLRPSKSFKRLDHDVFEVMADWHYFVLFELVNLKDFREDYDWLSEKLQFKISPDEIKEGFEKLISIGLLERSPRNQKLRQSHSHFEIPVGEVSEASKINHEQSLENAKRAIREIDPKKRKLVSGCFVVKENDLEKMQAEIDEFRKSLMEKYEKKDGEKVIQLQIQLYPHT